MDKRSASTVTSWAFGAVLIVFSVHVPAQNDPLAGLPDPTRPDLGLSAEALLARDPDAGAAAVRAREARKADAVLAPAAALELAYTLVSRSRRIALINGRAVQEGETVAGAKVVQIKPNQVSLSRDGKPLVLELAGYKKRLDETAAATGEKPAETIPAAKTTAADEVDQMLKGVPGYKGKTDGKK